MLHKLYQGPLVSRAFFWFVFWIGYALGFIRVIYRFIRYGDA